MLELCKVSKTFRGVDFKLDDVSLRLSRGIHALAGPNGAGKSTLLRIIAAIKRPDFGSIELNGQDVREDLFRYKLNLGYLPQKFGFYDQMMGRQFLLYMAGLKGVNPHLGRQRAEAASAALGLDDCLTRKIAAWSAGQRQRLGLAQALLNDPEILILDEPFCALGSREVEIVTRLLTGLSRHKVILISTHLLEGVNLDSLALLVNGRLEYSGSTAAFLAAARERVWSAETTKAEWLRLQPRYPLGTVILGEAGCRWRIISDTQPGIPGIKSVVPRMEEAYSWWIKRCIGPGKVRGDGDGA